MPDPDAIIDTLLGLDPLSDLPRTGWLLRGVRPCESIADHSFGVAMVAGLLVDLLRAQGKEVDGEKVLRMALVHDAPEARTADVPMPVKTAALEQAMADLEARLCRDLLPSRWAELCEEAMAGDSLAAKIVMAADKIQMMIKVLVYESQHRGDLEEFWLNPKNFRHMGLPEAEAIFSRICERANKPYPQQKQKP